MTGQPKAVEVQEELQEAIEAAHGDYIDSISLKKRLPREFLQGIVRGLGMAIGGTIIFALAAYLLGRFLLIPGIGNVVEGIRDDVATWELPTGE